jgi:peroxiredoxin
MAIFHDLIMATADLGTTKKVPKVLKIDEVVQDWQLSLTTNVKTKISSIISNGPLLLIFIRGTWCPFCRMHLKKLREWVKKLENSNASIIVVSSEPLADIRSWLDKNPQPYIFASDENQELSKYFGVHIEPNNFSQAATFLIDSNLTIRLAYSGKRTKNNFNEMDRSLKRST